MNQSNNQPTLYDHLALFEDYIECEEWHIHDDTGDHEGETAFDQHKDFDEIKAHSAIAQAITDIIGINITAIQKVRLSTYLKGGE